ncbi:MAG: biopolymer transporter ExbD [Treponema sp.]|nr:biopolymer transporter ExbD [Treponema sp.]
MKLRTRRGHVQANVDMTPMIDIVFQLILFFLVSTTFAVLPGIKLNLPQSRTSEGTSVEGITISANADGLLFFNDKEVLLENLGAELIAYDTGDKEKKDFPVSLEADSEVTNGTIVGIFDVIRESGYSVINLRTSTKK